MAQVRRNRKREGCAHCGITVEPNRGFLTKSERAHDMGQWLVYHEDCAPGHIRAEGYRLDRKELTKEGNLFHPYDEQAIPKIRALPGAWWNSTSRWWVVSLEMHDRRLLLEGAEELGLTVAPELIEEYERWKQSPKAWAAIARAREYNPDDHELHDCANWLADRTKAIANLTAPSLLAAAICAIEPGSRVILISNAQRSPSTRGHVASITARGFKLKIRNHMEEPWEWPGQDEILLTSFYQLPETFMPKVIGKDEEGKYIKAVNFKASTRRQAGRCLLIIDGATNIGNFKTSKCQKVTGLVSQTQGPWVLGALPKDPGKLWDVLRATKMFRMVFGNFKTFKRCFNAKAGKYNSIEWGEPNDEAIRRLQRVCFRRPY